MLLSYVPSINLQLVQSSSAMLLAASSDKLTGGDFSLFFYIFRKFSHHQSFQMFSFILLLFLFLSRKLQPATRLTLTTISVTKTMKMTETTLAAWEESTWFLWRGPVVLDSPELWPANGLSVCGQPAEDYGTAEATKSLTWTSSLELPVAKLNQGWVQNF